MSVKITINLDNPDQPHFTAVYGGHESRRVVFTCVDEADEPRHGTTRYAIERENTDGATGQVRLTTHTVTGPAGQRHDRLRRQLIAYLDDALHTICAVEAAHQEGT